MSDGSSYMSISTNCECGGDPVVWETVMRCEVGLEPGEIPYLGRAGLLRDRVGGEGEHCLLSHPFSQHTLDASSAGTGWSDGHTVQS